MMSPRTHRLTARAALVWFVLFVAASVASPWIRPSGIQVVCSAMGTMKLVDSDADSAGSQMKAGMDCPLCAPLSALPPTVGTAFDTPDSLAHALRPAVAAHLAWATGTPLPPRGPPSVA